MTARAKTTPGPPTPGVVDARSRVNQVIDDILAQEPYLAPEAQRLLACPAGPTTGAWIVDTGATNHVTDDDLATVHRTGGAIFQTAGGLVSVSATGTVETPVGH